MLIKGRLNEIIIQMRVHLCGGHTAMSKQDLYKTQVMRLPDKMCSTGMPEHMRGQPELIR